MFGFEWAILDSRERPKPDEHSKFKIQHPKFQPMTRLLVATRNAHKTREIREILGDGFEVVDLNERQDIPAVEETGATFQENATLKAVEASRFFDGLVLADDSGLEVDALGGAP